MFLLGWGEGGETWKWRRWLRAWEEELLVECRDFRNNVFLQATHEDKWSSMFDQGAGYSVCGAYQYLTSQEPHNCTVVSKHIWHKDVPLNISLFVWRLLCNRLPTRDNLVKRGIILYATQLCVYGCGNVESIDHLFLSCNVTSSLWVLCTIGLDLTQLIPSEFQITFLGLGM